MSPLCLTAGFLEVPRRELPNPTIAVPRSMVFRPAVFRPGLLLLEIVAVVNWSKEMVDDEIRNIAA